MKPTMKNSEWVLLETTLPVTANIVPKSLIFYPEDGGDKFTATYPKGRHYSI
jgi:hypothetical protein